MLFLQVQGDLIDSFLDSLSFGVSTVSMSYAAINFILNHPPGTQLKGAKTSPGDKTGSQKLHPQNIKLENFTNVSDTI